MAFRLGSHSGTPSQSKEPVKTTDSPHVDRQQLGEPDSSRNFMHAISACLLPNSDKEVRRWPHVGYSCEMRYYRQFRTLFVLLLYGCACLQFVRFYVRTSSFYLNLPAYLSGHERLPFQERILPVFLMRQISQSSTVMNLFVHNQGVATRAFAPFYVLSLVGMFSAAILTQMLYTKVSQRRTLSFLVLPLLVFCMLWTYVIHNEANFSYPYDLLSLAFFTGGLYCIHQRHYLPLLLVVLIGTLNRETTLFLVGIYIIDSASGKSEEGPGTAGPRGWMSLRGLSLRQVPWLRAGALFSVWLAVKLVIAYHFRYNDNSENFVRIFYNADRLKVRLLPALLNVCGYLLPVVLLYWSRLRPVRFGNYILILAVWVPVMFYTGVLLETRIYGELCSWTAIALTVLAEEGVARNAVASERDSGSSPAEITSDACATP